MPNPEKDLRRRNARPLSQTNAQERLEMAQNLAAQSPSGNTKLLATLVVDLHARLLRIESLEQLRQEQGVWRDLAEAARRRD